MKGGTDDTTKGQGPRHAPDPEVQRFILDATNDPLTSANLKLRGPQRRADKANPGDATAVSKSEKLKKCSRQPNQPINPIVAVYSLKADSAAGEIISCSFIVMRL